MACGLSGEGEDKGIEVCGAVFRQNLKIDLQCSRILQDGKNHYPGGGDAGQNVAGNDLVAGLGVVCFSVLGPPCTR